MGRPNAYVIDGESTHLIITRADGGKVIVFIDACDVDTLRQWHWHCGSNGHVYGRAANMRNKQGIHRVIMSPPSDMVVDHIDGDVRNDRRNNLRVVTKGANNQNRHRPGRAGKTLPRGVYVLHRRGHTYFHASGGMNNRKIHIGSFKTAEEADAGAKAWRAEHMPFSLEARQ